MTVRHADAMVFVWGSEPPAFSIGYEPPASARDSGLTVLFDDAPDPDEVDDPSEHPALKWLCLGCLLEEHPEVGLGLDIARRFGVADLDDDGHWVLGDPAGSMPRLTDSRPCSPSAE